MPQSSVRPYINPLLQVTVRRDSVSERDEQQAPHELHWQIPQQATVRQLFEHLRQLAYAPLTQAAQVMWHASVGGIPLFTFKAQGFAVVYHQPKDHPLSRYTAAAEHVFVWLSCQMSEASHD